MAENFPVYDSQGQRLAEVGGINVVKILKGDGNYAYVTAAFKSSAGNDYADAYNPIRAETSSVNAASMRYFIPDIPIPWKLDNSGGHIDFYVVAISCDGQIVENLSSAYLSYDNENGTLTVAPVFGEKDFCVYVFRNEEAINLFAIKADGNASLASVLAQFEKDNRVLKQLQALQRRNLRAPDECSILPEAAFRKNKILAFDANGQPSLWLDVEEIQSVYAARNQAIQILSEVRQLAAQVELNKDTSLAARNSAQGYANAARTDSERAVAAFDGATSAAESAESDAAATASKAAEVATVYDELTKVYNESGAVVANERGMIVPVKVDTDTYVPSFMIKD